jgi:hypothetical protein
MLSGDMVETEGHINGINWITESEGVPLPALEEVNLAVKVNNK